MLFGRIPAGISGGMESIVPKLDYIFTVINKPNHIKKFLKFMYILRNCFLILKALLKFLSLCHPIVHWEIIIEHLFKEFAKSPMLVIHGNFLGKEIISFAFQIV